MDPLPYDGILNGGLRNRTRALGLGDQILECKVLDMESPRVSAVPGAIADDEVGNPVYATAVPKV